MKRKRSGRRRAGEKIVLPSIELHIEELVLHGFDPRDRHAIGDAVERELVRLLERPGPFPSLDSPLTLDHMDVGSFSVKPGATRETVGQESAHALHRGINSLLPHQ